MGPVSPAKEQEDPCIITSSLEIGQILKDLCKTQSIVSVGTSTGKKMESMILEVDDKSRQIIYKAGWEVEVAAVTSSPRVYFYSSLRGVAVNFAVTSAIRTSFAEDPALRSPMPAEMEYLQRREHFRPPLYKSYTSTVKMPDGKPAVMDLRDISVGGVGLSSATISDERLPPGSVVDACLDFAELGKIDVTLKILMHRRVERQGTFTHTYGCRFQDMSRDIETKVQQLVFKLERISRPWWHVQ